MPRLLALPLGGWLGGTGSREQKEEVIREKDSGCRSQGQACNVGVACPISPGRMKFKVLDTQRGSGTYQGSVLTREFGL